MDCRLFDLIVNPEICTMFSLTSMLTVFGGRSTE